MLGLGPALRRPARGQTQRQVQQRLPAAYAQSALGKESGTRATVIPGLAAAAHRDWLQHSVTQ